MLRWIEYRYELVVPEAYRDDVRTLLQDIGADPIEPTVYWDSATFWLETPALAFWELRRWRRVDERELREIADKYGASMTRSRIRTV